MGPRPLHDSADLLPWAQHDEHDASTVVSLAADDAGGSAGRLPGMYIFRISGYVYMYNVQSLMSHVSNMYV